MILRLYLATVLAKRLIQFTGMNIFDACRYASNRYDVDSTRVYRILTD